MKRRVFILLLVIALLFSVTACSSEEKKASPQGENACSEITPISLMLGEAFREEWIAEDVTCRVMWDNLRLSAEDEEKYPEMKKNFDEINDKAKEEAEKLLSELITAAKELEGEAENPIYCSGEAEVFMQRADSDAISYLEKVYVYSGGIHPDYYYHGKNFNTQSGEEIKLSDVISNISELPGLLANEIEEKYSDVVFTSLAEHLSAYAEEEFSWTIDYQGITFWFSPYDIAAYAVGPLSIKLYFDEMSELFTGEYMENAPDVYAISLPSDLEVEFDLKKNDGKRDKIYLGKSLDRTGSYYMFNMTVNGTEYINDVNYSYSFDTNLVHMKDRNYIYYVSYHEGDYNLLNILDINDGEIKQVFEMRNTQFAAEFVEEAPGEGIVYRPFFNNPQDFRLSTGIEIIGNRDAEANYKADANGIPVMNDESFNIETEMSQTLKVPLEAKVLPDMKTETIPEGTEVWGVRTDKETYIDMRIPDGREVRFDIDVSGWPRKVNGLPEEECFENIMYAG